MEDLLSYEGYHLVFEDQFDGTELDRSHWNVELRPPGWVNEEWQEYVDSTENISVRDGKLLIRPVKTVRGDGSVSYTSGRITTQHKHDFIHGLFEARLKVPRGKGFLPAFWLMTTDEDRYGQWPECGEIDIMEIWGSRTGTNHGTIHYCLPHRESQGTVTLENGDFAEEFHDFALLWEPGLLRWYVDGRPFYETREWFSAGADGVKKPYPAPGKCRDHGGQAHQHRVRPSKADLCGGCPHLWAESDSRLSRWRRDRVRCTSCCWA